MRGLPILFLLVLAQASFSFADVITFNTNAACATAGGTCAFYDNSTWVEEVVPGAHDTAIIHTTAPVTLSLDPVSLPSKSWTVWEINMTGPVTLLISNISFDVTELTWDETSSVSVVEESSASLLGVVGYGSIYVKDSFLNVNIMSVSSGEIVSSTLQTILPKSSVKIDTLNISDSYTNVVTLTTNFLHATGNMFFGYAQVYVNTFGALFNIPNLYMSTTLVVGGDATVNIIDCNTSINAVTMQISSTLNFSTSSPANTASIGTYQSYSASLILNDNVRLTLGGNYVDDVIFGNNAVLNIVGTTYIKSLQQAGQVTPGTINISDTLQTQQTLLSVPVQIYLAPTGIFSAPYNVTMTPNAQGICGISGPGRLMITGGYFQCLGQLNVGQITVGSYLSVSTLNTSALTAGAYGSIVGNVVLSGEDAELDFFYGSTTFIINGGYTQQGGAISVSMNFVPVEPLLQVHGKLSLEDVDVDVYVQGFEKGDEFNLAESTHKIEAKFGEVEDLITQTHEIYAYVEGEYIVVQDKKEGFVKENWPWLIVVGVLTIIWILLMVCLHKCTKDSKRTFDDPHESISAYLKGISIKKMTCVDWAFLIILSVILVPLLVEAAAITLVLAALIPIGFIFGLIEHRFVFVWAVIVLFAQLGSVLDLFADIILIAKFLVFYIQTQWNSNGDHTPTEWDKLEGQELQLFFARLGMTLGGALMSLLMVVLLQGSLGTLLDKISGVKFFTDGKANNKTVSTGSGPVFAVFVLAAVSFWKVFLVAVRLHLLIQVAKSLWKNGKLEEKVQRMVTWIEMFFYFDLMWSGIPLGVLTGLELFVYKEDFELDPETVFEILKLSALVVDLVSASFLFYYTICGLIKKVPCLHHAHHEHHDDESPHHHAKHEVKHTTKHAKHDAKHDAINISASEHDPLLANKK